MIKISACVIVKNEAENIGRWLNCVRQLADEIIIIENGRMKTRGTREAILPSLMNEFEPCGLKSAESD